MALPRLTEQASYQSPERRAGWFARCHPNLVFYTQIFNVVRRASRLARQGRYDGKAWIESSLASVRALESIGGSFDLQNLGVVARLRGPCVFIANHMSILETFILPCLIQPHRNVTFVVKESLISYPLFGHVMRSRDPVVVGRKNPREDFKVVLEEGQRRLAADVSVVIFPQTTRSVDFDPQKFNSLGVKLAKRCQVPIVPVALKTDAWGLGKRFKDIGWIRPEKRVRIRFGEPLTVGGSGRQEHAAVAQFIAAHLNAWRQ
ncbi:MAG: 1-acyl-sn-glycerol-3-phosphate acyltransferase [Desulfobacterales bacterium]|jgi:1-acyl-sn-glycerol-3-phosphate acyltransferase|nr:1-acyl-sn-glycerol-3-phosphate acyltransferase [Desulfobacterales bacterium]